MQRRPIAGQLSQPSNMQLNFETARRFRSWLQFQNCWEGTLDPVVKPKKSTELKFSTDCADRQKGNVQVDGLAIPGSIAPANPIEERGERNLPKDGRRKKGPHPEPDNEESPQADGESESASHELDELA